MSATEAVAPCDCLECCGDDPWLGRGKTVRCAELGRPVDSRALEAVIAARAERAALRSVLAIADQYGCGSLIRALRLHWARALVESGMPPVSACAAVNRVDKLTVADLAGEAE